MKPYIPFGLILCMGAVLCSWRYISRKDCLFYIHDYCYTCDEKEIFFVGLPENCTVCPNKQARYVNWNGKSIWACSSDITDEEIEFQDLQNPPCPKERSLRDILGHCYTCDTPESVQIAETDGNNCSGKRYLTRYRNSKKSNLCPSFKQIQDPYVCVSCQGQWQNEECTVFSWKAMNFCKKNSDCPDNQWCYPFTETLYSKQGICRPNIRQKWICSVSEGYTRETAWNFCARQEAKIPSFNELENDKEMVLSACSKNNVWVLFDEGTLYLDSLKTPFVITKEKDPFETGGDNTHALCIQN